MSGFVAMSRTALDHPLLKDGERFRAWFWIVAAAAWKPSRVKIKGAVVTLERGELSYSVRFLAEKWGWSKSRVDRFLADLRAEGMIETRSKIGTTAGHNAGQGQSIITICNFDKYQDPLTRKRDNVEPEIGTTAGQQRDKEEQGNNILPFDKSKGDDPSKQFWDSARGYLGASKVSLVGKLAGQYGQAVVAKAITDAMLMSPQPADRSSYIIGILKRGSVDEPVVGI